MSESKKPFAILRVKKLAKHSLWKVHAHNNRDMLVPHAQKGIKNTSWTHDGSDKTTAELVQEKLAQYLNKKIKNQNMRIQKNSVVAMEILLTASPEFFEDKSSKEVDEWLVDSKEWLMKKFTHRVLQITTHFDEKSPHMHCIIVPINYKIKTERRTDEQRAANELGVQYKVMSLCANDIFTPDRLRKMQTEYANCVKKFGLRRGLKKSGATHTSVKEYYARTAELPEVKRKLKVKKKELDDCEVSLKIKQEEIKKVTEGILNLQKQTTNEEKHLITLQQMAKEKVDEEVQKTNKLKTTLENIQASIKLEKDRLDKVEARKNGLEIEINEIIDIYFHPFINHFENLLSNLTPEAISFYKEKCREFDENMVKLKDKIPEKLPSKIRSEIKNVLSM